MRCRGARHIPFIRVLAVGAALTASVAAQAFSIADHQAVTRRAFAELRACHLLTDESQFAQSEPAWASDVLSWIEDADTDEDLNLIRKWTHYSHYFNPLKKLDMSRADSSATIDESVATLTEPGATSFLNLEDRARLLGRIIHHIQDAAVPAHVVPVSHWITDGFESWSIEWPAFHPDCEALKKDREAEMRAPMDLLRAQALQTWASLDEPLQASLDGKPVSLSWHEDFWTEGPGQEFGSYGKLGNEFGALHIATDSGELQIQASAYEAYKVERIREAVRSTQAAWSWFLRLPKSLP